MCLGPRCEANLFVIPQNDCYKMVSPSSINLFSLLPHKTAMSGSNPTASQEEAANRSLDHDRALILVVERNPAVQRLERYFLEQAGFTVEFANDGEAALKSARELHPRILVTEILVPKLDGLSLCRELKNDAETSDIVVLIFSHLNAEDRAREVGADAFLVKPLNEQLLLETVQRLLELQRELASKSRQESVGGEP